MEDPLAATENIFVVLTPGNKYYFVPNLDRAILARHINEQVRVTGDVDQARSSIRAQRLEVNQNGRWRTAWDYDMQRQFQESGSGPYRRQP